MKNRRAKLFIVAMALVAGSGSALAHHGTANFDMTKLTTVTGTITEFQFINPHAEIFFDAKDDKGKIQKWQAETNSPNLLHRVGWTRESLKPGDQVTVTGNRAKDGSNLLRLVKLAFADGKELPAANGANTQ